MKKTKMKDLIVLWIALAALVCAALALNRSLNQLISNMETVKAGPLPEDMVAAFDEAWKITKGDSPEYFTLYKGKGSVGGEKK